MAVVRWDPFRDLSMLQDRMNRLFDDAGRTWRNDEPAATTSWSPAVDIFETEGATSHRIERAYGEFSRAFSIPATVDEEKIRADYKDGVLQIVLPKKDQAKPKQIRISE